MKKFKLRVLSKIKEDSLSGPMSPMEAMKVMFREMELGLQGLIRVEQVEPGKLNIHNFKNEKEAYCDYLIGITLYKNNYAAILIVDQGYQIIGVSMFTSSEVFEPGLSEEYLKEPFGEHLTMEELLQIQSQTTDIEPLIREEILKVLN